MTCYRLFFLDKSGAIQARDDYTAKDAAAAFFIAKLVFDACSDVYTSYEVWSGLRRVAFPVPDDRQTMSKNPLLDREEAHTAELIVAERERVLLDSRWSVARSRRLLSEKNRLESKLSRAPILQYAKSQQ